MSQAAPQRDADSTADSTAPSVTDDDARADAAWYAAHPDRRYRVRPGAEGRLWAIRKRGRVLLWTFAATPVSAPADTEAAAEACWWAWAWPDLTPAERKKLIAKSRRKGGAA